MHYLFRLGTPDGRVIEEMHEGTDLSALTRDLERRGFHVFEAKPKGGLFRFGLGSRTRRAKRVPDQTFLVFNQELAALLNAGLPLLQALEMMHDRARNADFKNVLGEIRNRVESGAELSVAFEEHGDLFPRLYPSSLRAGERSGDLVRVLQRFVRYLNLVLDARRRVVSALVYPAVLVVLSITMIAIMGIYVVPRFSVFYADLGAELPLLTRVTLAISFGLRDNLAIIVVFLVAGGWAFGRWRRSPAGRVTIDRWLLRVPLLGIVFHRFALSEYCRSLATLLEGGFPLVPSLEIAVASVSNTYVRERLRPTIAMVREGRPLNAALEQTEVVEELAVDMVKVGETTGALDAMLTRVSDFLDQEVETRMARILSLVEPVMLVFMGVIVALLLVSVYLPMFSVLGQVGL